ncbi:unnamed protein product [Adineta steineri]|uniref:RING-type domain-containing protein n=1 Tax=Adineta steineri TaxID=433720 RepID=A0A816DBD5_9BILA|nr:unnamed protein product [Adineta steineri]CAF1632667.1 unnamed protein product [Adineta steineri]
MAAVLTPVCNNVHNITMSNEPTFTNLQNIKVKLYRLGTFRSWKENLYSTLSKGLLAKAGFCYIETEHKLKCQACNFEVDLSAPVIHPIEEHMKQNPQCEFALIGNELSPKNYEKLSMITNDISQMDTNNVNHQTQINDDNDASNENQNKSFLKTLSNEVIDKIRFNTFSNWPLITPAAQDMFLAGWSYTSIADRVICTHCNAIFHKWTELDRPYEIHRLKSPQCQFVLAVEKKEGKTSTSAIRITTEPNTQAAVETANNMYSLAIHRYETFQKNWPHTNENPLPSIESFVDAGFFYTGDQTIVKCFYCKKSLKHWAPTDDPKVEHARWFPECSYIRQYIGEDLFQAIQRKNRELKAQSNPEENIHVQTSQLPLWTTDEIDRMVKARLDLPIVEKIRQIGFTMAVIRKAYEIQLKFKKDDFKTDNDLRFACLILDLQVNLIKGDAAYILTPQDWMKKYIHDQQQPQPQIVQLPIKTIETPKVIKSAVVQPKVVVKTDEEAMPCVLCLTTERQVACLPCGHLTSCVACGHSLKTCPLCRATVKAFVRIYI